jgi:hypothetical protein
LSSSPFAARRSVRTAVPLAVRNDVRRTFVSPTYARSIVAAPSVRMLQAPPSAGSRRRAKIDGLSNCGQQSQSIEPSRETSATLRLSPIGA